MTLNQSRIKEWTDTLRTTKIPQTRSTLVEVRHGKTSMCCLGVGEVLCAGGRIVVTEDVDVAILDPQGTLREELNPDLPVLFLRWLGLDVEDRWDLQIDLPQPFYVRPPYDWQTPYALSRMTVAALNDNYRLTFSQIADMVDYFGISGVAK